MSEYVKLDDTVYFTVNFYHPTSGFSYAADATPIWLVYESGASLILQNNMIIRNTIVGSYWGNFIASAANGFVAQRFYDIQVSGTVAGISGFSSVKQFVLNDVYDVNIVQTSGEWASPQSKIDANIVSVSGIDISIENFRDNVSAVNVRTEIDLNSLKLTAISGSVAGLAGDVMRGTDNAALTTNLNAVSGVLVARTLFAADYFDWANDTVANVTTVATTTNLTNLASGAIADVVWDEMLSGHQTLGSTGYALNVASGNLIGETGASAQQVWEYSMRGLNVAVAVSGIVDANIVSVSCQMVSPAATVNANLIQINGVGFELASAVSVSGVVDSNVVQVSGNYVSIEDFGGTGSTPPTVEQIRAEMDVNSLKLTAISCSVAGLAGAAMRGTDGAALATNLDSVSGVLVARSLVAASYFDPATDQVMLIDTYMNHLVSISGDVVGLDGAAMRGTDGAALATNLDAVSGVINVIAGDVVNLDGAAMRGTDNAALATNLMAVSGVISGLDQDIYYAAIKYISDTTNNVDEFAVQWFKNDQVVSSGALTVPAISVYNTNTGVSVFEHQPMSYASPNLGVVRYNRTPMALASGEPYLVETSGTIDATNRVWKTIVGIDLL